MGDDHPFHDLIEAQIEQARARGEFDNLSGAGKPLPPQDTSVDAMTQTAQRIMAEHGVLPEELTVKAELRRLRGALRDETDRDKRKDLLAKIADLELRANLAAEARIRSLR